MSKFSCRILMLLSLSGIVISCPKLSAQNLNTQEKPAKHPTPALVGKKSSSSVSGDLSVGPSQPSPTREDTCKDIKAYTEGNRASEIIHVYYLRSAPGIKDVLNKITEGNSCLKDTVIEAQDQNGIIIYGYPKQRQEIERIIAILDFPRERVNLDMWGILISSDNPRRLAEVMREINQVIDQTQQLLQETYKTLETYSREEESRLDLDYKKLLQEILGFSAALSPNRPFLSMTDIALSINAAEDPIERYNLAAENICNLFKKPQYKDYVANLEKKGKKPFENFLKYGLHQPESVTNSSQNCTGNIPFEDQQILKENLLRRMAVLNFALEYSELRSNPAGFDPKSFQESAENLNSLLYPLIDAINRDISDLFIEPTLEKIQNIVRKYRDVEYAEVGKTRVAGLNGIKSTVTSQTVSTVEEDPPLRLNELLREAGEINEFSTQLLPETVQAGSQGIPVASLVSLVSALSRDASLWRGLTSGISMEITPSVLRNSASAELNIVLRIGPEKVETETSKEPGKLRPLSRINQNTVTTSVYVNTLDIFALSTFNNQTTVDGGRSYIPVIGTVWKGIFSGIPIFGNLFSWENSPKNIQHQSIVLTNSFIVPTALGLAPLYSSAADNNAKKSYQDRCLAIADYKNMRQQEIGVTLPSSADEQTKSSKCHKNPS